MANIHGEPSRSEGAVDTAIRIMGSNLGELGSLRDVSGRTEHQQRVERMMVGFNHSVPIKPMDPGPETRVLRARLIMEECLETIQDGLRVKVGVRVEVGVGDKSVDFDSLVFVAKDGPADLIELADGCADVSVVTIGTLSAFGIKDRALLEEVDANNLSKIDTGRTNEHGKFTKHPDHMPPRIAMVLMAQGWQNPDEPF
ncbi:MAG: hypothetical protein E4G90_00420 [Gemmatimonadales bacterium]|nr:MAG: hypothetical protein E4G90_00420 [Gemmatimonadales bacterium]